MTEEKKSFLGKGIALIVVAIIVLVGIGVYTGYVDVPEPILNLFKTSPEYHDPAEVELYKFSDLNNNDSVNVELWIMNIGDETAKDISVFVRARNQDGEVLFSENISMTVILLQKDDTCSGTYVIPITGDDTTIFHTIEVTWSDGRVSYSKETQL